MKNYFMLIVGLLISSLGWATHFIDNGNGTVTDAATGLVWQQTDGGGKTWEQAISYCEGLTLAGVSDWRLPNRNELQSLVDYSKSSPAIDTTYFPNTLASYYCSSTTFAESALSSWGVHFGSGHFSTIGKTSSPLVRCVRGGT